MSASRRHSQAVTKIPETDAIFANRKAKDWHREADPVKRMRRDCKATVKRGDFSRGGKTRADNKGCDHALGSAAKDIPGGLVDQDPGQLHMTLGGSYKTSDCLVHTRQEWGHELSAHERQGTALIPIQVDKGAESSGVRTQFLHRPVEWTDPIGKPIP